ncbi:Mitochondrial fission 1 protein [Trichinella pseudospiralis]|uniref:Mitochondrial fission 1 protein n=1 Tax=Trichinella pseudospiralis TaxID=6337 RepID=A0A0V1DWN9_TRIPS|nr:Mitochondrial fission 1 protein [Trichinella pseudospiralis]KRY66030.1 Mitochondrial fission 1 protein [Trichinella pseudospiralis]KRZ19919.1 Mitochondrial fission 1 protein [Trichinella pseudospiralis]KRZ35719.1 Mitochondrial fission 1 protein [Trichinella pseudospiralis]
MDVKSLLEQKIDEQTKNQIMNSANDEQEHVKVFKQAYCLIRGEKDEIAKGLTMLKDLLISSSDDNEKRDYLYHMAIGNARLRLYDNALDYVDTGLVLEPENQQFIELKRAIEAKMRRDGLLGGMLLASAAMVGGVALLAGLAIHSKLRRS